MSTGNGATPHGDPDPATGVERERATRQAQAALDEAADLDQRASDGDAAGSELDQAASDTDRALSESDQTASDIDQAAADRDEQNAEDDGADTRAYEASRQERAEATRDRDATAAARARTTADRLGAAADRDERAERRDRAADARDRTADAEDRAAAAQDRAAEMWERRRIDAGAAESDLLPGRARRVWAAGVREHARAARAAAAADRRAAAADRERAALDRRSAGIDELTGVYRRGAGEMALSHEIDRSRRSGLPLVLALIDVDGLKRLNDGWGHAAGDAVLRDVPAAIRSVLRSYDLTVRWGGDEFVCVLSDAGLDVASERVRLIQRALERLRPGASISAGLAELEPRDTLESLVARADRDLYRGREGRHG